MSNEISFEEAYEQATNEAIHILGNVVSKIVTDYVEHKYSIHLTKTASNPAALDEALEHAIDGGRIIVERRLINLLYEKLGLQLNSQNIVGIETGTKIVTFERRVEAARQEYLHKKSKQ
jgi:hypothetical protein